MTPELDDSGVWPAGVRAVLFPLSIKQVQATTALQALRQQVGSLSHSWQQLTCTSSSRKPS